MSKPMLIFCPNVRAKELSENAGIPILRVSTLKEILAHLARGNPIIVTENHLLLQGWKAPEGTIAFFVEGFPTEGPVRLQAEGRYNHVVSRSAQNNLSIDDIPIATNITTSPVILAMSSIS